MNGKIEGDSRDMGTLKNGNFRIEKYNFFKISLVDLNNRIEKTEKSDNLKMSQ